jgi:hypothetical protein
VSAPWRRWCGARTPVGTTRRQPATTRNDIPTKHHSRAWQFQPNDSPSLSLSLSLLRVSFWCRVDAVTPCNLPRGIYFCVGSKCWLVSHSSQSFENISAEKMTTSDDYTYWISFPSGARGRHWSNGMTGTNLCGRQNNANFWKGVQSHPRSTSRSEFYWLLSSYSEWQPIPRFSTSSRGNRTGNSIATVKLYSRNPRFVCKFKLENSSQDEKCRSYNDILADKFFSFVRSIE